MNDADLTDDVAIGWRKVLADARLGLAAGGRSISGNDFEIDFGSALIDRIAEGLELLTPSGESDPEYGYTEAFYEISALLGIGAQDATPETVFRTQMLPKLRALIAAEHDRFATPPDAAVRQQLTWQPVETAPSDTVVLLYSPERHFTNPERIESAIYRDSRAGWNHAWATHWMPLPPFPAIEADTTGAQEEPSHE